MERKTTQVVEIDDTGVAVLTVPPLRKAAIRKLMIYNADSSDHTVLIGNIVNGNTGTFKQLLPAIKVAAGSTLVLGESELPGAETGSTETDIAAIYARTGEAITANRVQLVLEIEWR